MSMQRLAATALLAIACSLAAANLQAAEKAVEAPQGLNKIKHVIVIYLENRSFDNLYGEFPGANGLANAGATATQVDKAGKVYAVLPRPINTSVKPAVIDSRFPADLPNKPFAIDPFIPIGERTGDLVHRYYQEQAQIDGGKMDKFAAISDAAGLTMGYYSEGKYMQLSQWAKRYVLADNFYHAAFGGSFLNHFWFVCACTPRFDNAPKDMVAQLDAAGNVIKDGAVTPDGFAVNTLFTSSTPHPKGAPADHLLPLQDMPTIGDRLSEKGVSWAWYSGGWDDALAGKPDKDFQFHHQPFAFFKNYAEGTPGRAQHLKDAKEFFAGIAKGTLPAVSFYKPIGELNQHPGYAEVVAGDRHVADLLKRINQSPLWRDVAVIITPDENGGFWDHVAPPKKDKWGPGTRVPTVIVSPFAKRGYVDHSEYDTTSILRFIEARYGLAPLGERDAKTNDLTGAFKF